MRLHGVRRVLALMLAAWGCGCGVRQQAQAPVDTGAITATVDSLSRAFAAAVAARDTNAVADLYADDARVLPPNAPRSDGKDAIRKVWAGFLSTPGLELSLQTQQVVVSDAGDMAVEIGAYQMKMQDPAGNPTEDAGKYVTVYKRMQGQWKIVVDTWNSDRPAVGAGT